MKVLRRVLFITCIIVLIVVTLFTAFVIFLHTIKNEHGVSAVGKTAFVSVEKDYKSLKQNDLVILKTVNSTDDLTADKIISINTGDGFTTVVSISGDNIITEDGTITIGQVNGVLSFRIVILGLLVDFCMLWYGYLSLAGIIILFLLLCILLKSRKNKKADKESDQNPLEQNLTQIKNELSNYEDKDDIADTANETFLEADELAQDDEIEEIESDEIAQENEGGQNKDLTADEQADFDDSEFDDILDEEFDEDIDTQDTDNQNKSQTLQPLAQSKVEPQAVQSKIEPQEVSESESKKPAQTFSDDELQKARQERQLQLQLKRLEYYKKIEAIKQRIAQRKESISAKTETKPLDNKTEAKPLVNKTEIKPLTKVQSEAHAKKPEIIAMPKQQKPQENIAKNTSLKSSNEARIRLEQARERLRQRLAARANEKLNNDASQNYQIKTSKQTERPLAHTKDFAQRLPQQTKNLEKPQERQTIQKIDKPLYSPKNYIPQEQTYSYEDEKQQKQVSELRLNAKMHELSIEQRLAEARKRLKEQLEQQNK